MSFNPYVNPYLQAQQSQFNQQSADVPAGVVTPEQLALQRQQQQANYQTLYTQPALNAVDRVKAQTQNNSYSAQLGEQLQAWSNPNQATAQERMRAKANEAHQSAAARLGDKQAQQDKQDDDVRISLGEDPNKVRNERAELNKFKEQASEKERIANYEAFKANPNVAKKDLELLRDIEFTPVEAIQSKYASKPELLQYILQQKEERQVQALQATAFDKNSDGSVFNPRNFASALVSGIGENVGGITDAYNMATKSGQERIDALNNSLTGQIDDFANQNIQNQAGRASDTRADANAQYEELMGRYAYLQAKQAGATDEQADNAAEWARTKESVNSLVNNPYQLTKEIAQFVPDVALSLTGGGLIAKGAKEAGQLTKKKLLKDFEKNEAKQIKEKALKEASDQLSKKEKEKLAEEAVNKAKKEFTAEVDKNIAKQVESRTTAGIAAFEAVNEAAQNAPQGYQTASTNIIQMPLEALKETKGFKEMQAKHPELSDKEIQIKMADEAGVKGYDYAAAVSAISGAIGSKAEANLVLGKGKKLAGAGINAVQEGVTEGGSVVVGNEATNEKTQDRTVGTYTGAGKSAVIGALASGGTTAAVSTPYAIKRAISAPLEGALKHTTKKQEAKINTESDKVVNDVFGVKPDTTASKTDKTDSTNTDTTATTTNTENTKSVFGKNFSETNFGKKYNEITDDLLQDEAFKTVIPNKNEYTNTVGNLFKVYSAVTQELANAQQNNDTEQVKELQAAQTKIQNALGELAFALNKDITESSQVTLDLMQQINNTSVNSEEFQNLWDKYHEELDKDDRIQKLRETPLYKMLNGEIVTQKDLDEHNQRITSVDIMGDSDYSVESIDTVSTKTLEENKKIIQNLDRANPQAVQEASRKIATNLAKLSASVAKATQSRGLTLDTLKGIHDKYRAQLKELNNLAKKTGNNNLVKIVESYDQLLSKPLDELLPQSTETTSNTAAVLKAYAETMFGGANLGLMDYLTKALANGGTLKEKDKFLLSKFGLSQKGKLAGLNEAQAKLQAGEKEVNVTNRHLRPQDEDYLVKTASGNPITFTNIPQLVAYRNRIAREHNLFNQIGGALLDLDLNQTANQAQTVQQQQVKPKDEPQQQSQQPKQEEVKQEEPKIKTEETTKSNEEIKATEPETDTEEDTIDDPDYNSLVQTVEPTMTFNERIVISTPYIADRVAVLWNSAKDKWGKSNNVDTSIDSKETDTVYELHTSNGVQEIRIPMSAMLEMQKKGFNPTVNLFDALTKVKDESEHSTLTKEEINNFVEKPSVDTLGKSPITEALTPVMKLVNKYFGGKTLSIFANKQGSLLNKFHLVNGFLNLLNVAENKDGTPRVIVPNEVKLAFAKATSLALADFRSLAMGNDKQYNDYWYETEGASRVEIQKSTTKSKFGNKYSDNATLIEAEEGENLAPHEVGIVKNDLIVKLGKLVLDQLGYQFDKSSPYYNDESSNGLVYSLGIEAYNMLLNNGYIDTYNVNLYTSDEDGNESFHKTIPYVNFKLNTDADSKVAKAVDVLLYNMPYEDMSIEQAQAIIDTNSTYKIIFELGKEDNQEEAKRIFGSNEYAKPEVIVSNLDDRNGKDYKTKDYVEKSKTKNDITNTYNDELDSSVAHHDAVTFKINVPLYQLMKSNPEAIQLAFGYVPDVDSMNVTTATKKAMRSKNNAILRAMGIINKYVDNALAQGIPLDKIAFNFPHHFVSNMRIMMESDLNPQSNKVMREMLQLVDTKVDDKTGTIQGELDLSVNLSTQFKTKDEPRTAQQLMDKANSKRKSEIRNIAIGLLLALNQGLDIGKIEKTRNQFAFQQVVDELDNPDSLLSKMTDLVWKMQQAEEQSQEFLPSDEEQALLKEFGAKMGNGSPRAMSALQTWANFKYRNTNQDTLKGKKNRGKFSTPLYVEADGIGNGLYNITRQFVTKFTNKYFNTLKRTGTVTLDILAQKMINNAKRFKKIKTNEEFLQEFAGSAGLFTDEQGTKRLQDIYETIATKLAKSGNESLQRVIKYFNDNKGKHNLDLSKITLQYLNDKNLGKLPVEIQDDLRYLLQLGSTGHSTVKANLEKTPLTQLVFEAYKTIAVDGETLNQLAGDFEVARNLAKAGVTPTVYGGQLTGIANQLINDIKKRVISNWDKCLEAYANKDREAYGKIVNELRATYASLDIAWTTYDEYKERYGSDKTIPDYINMMANRVTNQSIKAVNSLKKGLASELRNAVQESYTDEFAMLNFAMAQDDIAFANFTSELASKIKQAIKERNEAKGYAENDPRSYTALSRAELRKVIKTITSAPVIATAYSNNAILFEDVFALGNALVKEGKYDIDSRTTINAQYENQARGNYVHNIATQMFATYQKFNVAGASQATSTIPSTESKTQTTLLEKLMKALHGITHLNVFDGVDGKIYFRDLLGSLVNESTNEVHLNTSILENFYHKFTRSGIDETIINKKGLSNSYLHLLSQELSIPDFISEALSAPLTLNDAKHLLSFITLVQMQVEQSKLQFFGSEQAKEIEFGELYNPLTSLFNGLKSQLRTKILEGIDEGADTIYPNKLSRAKYETLSSGYGIQTQYFNRDKPARNVYEMGTGLYNATISMFSDAVASNRATKHIEKTILPAIINQFAGANRGFLYNPLDNDEYTRIARGFFHYVENKLGAGSFATIDLVNDSSLLVEYLEQDPIIREEYNKKYKQVYKQLHKPYVTGVQHDIQEGVTNPVKTVKDVASVYKNMDSPVAKVIKTMATLINPNVPIIITWSQLTKEHVEQFLPKDLVNYGFTREETVEFWTNKLKKQNSGGNYSRTTLYNKKGEPVPFNYIRIGSRTFFDHIRGSSVIAHELVHAVGDMMYGYMVDTAYQNELKESNPELAERLETFVNRLQANIQTFVDKNSNLEAIQERLHALRTRPELRHHYVTLGEAHIANQSAKVANIANYIYFFNELNEDNLPEGMTLEQLQVARNGTLHELMAFSLTEPETANELSVHKEVAWYENLTNTLRDFYKGVKESIRNMFGFKSTTNTESDEYKATSMFEAMLESMVGFNQALQEAQSQDLSITDDLSKRIIRIRQTKGYNTEKTQRHREWAFDANRQGVSPFDEQTNEQLQNQNTEQTNNIDGVSDPIAEAITDYSPAINSQMSETNALFRNKVKESIKAIRSVGEDGSLSYPVHALELADNNISKQVSQAISEARSNGFNVSIDEENDIKLAYKLNQISQDTNHPSVKHLHKLVGQQVDNLPDGLVKAVNNSGLDENSLLLAVLTLSKAGNNLITDPANNNQSKLKAKWKNLTDASEGLFDFGNLDFAEKQLPSLHKLQLALADFNKQDVKSTQERNYIVEQEIEKAKDVQKISDTLQEVIEKVPTPLHQILAGSSDFLTGRDLLPSGLDQDSSLGQLVRLWVRNHEQLKGRNTALTKLISWIVGQDSSTQYAAKFKGEASQLNALIRERLATVIPKSIREQFENLTDKHEEALNNVLMQSNLNRLGRLNISVSEALTSKKARHLAIAELEGNIYAELDNLGFKDKNQEKAMNFIKWQVQGLGEWVVTQEAKTDDVHTHNYILPNALAISSLVHISDLAGKDFDAENNTKALRDSIEKLVSLYSLEHHNQDDLDTIAELATEEPKAFRFLLNSIDTLDNEMEVYGNDNYLGFDGYVANKRNPYKDIKLLNPNEDIRTYRKQKEQLSKLGYTVKATLDNGTEVWYTDENPTNRFTTGIFNLSEHSVRGADVNRLTPLHSFDTEGAAHLHGESPLSHHPALQDSNYYSKLEAKNSQRTLINGAGEIVGISTALPKRIEKDLIQTFENGIDAIGNMKGRITEEIVTEANNKYYIDKLIDVYKEKARKGQADRFIKFNGKYKPKSKNKADIEFANRVNNIYNSLPISTKQYIKSQGGLYIERTEVDNLLGYAQGSVTDIYTGKSGLPEPVQQCARATINGVAKLFGVNPVKLAKRLERGLSEVAGLSKDFILVRSGVVAVGNMLSNVVHLWNTGIPLTKIPTYIREGFIEVRRYNQEYNRSLELRHLISVTNESKQKAKYQLELNALEKSLSKNPVLPLVNEGILTNISSASGIEEENPYGLINTAQQKIGFQKFKQTKVGKVWANVMIQEGSSTHSFMNGALDYGDFVAKYALYKHLTQNRQFDSERALNVIRDEFINYVLNRGRMFDWLNKVGLTWFLSYKLGIQKIFLRNLRRNFLRSATVYSGAKLIGTNQVVPAQNLLFDGSLHYQTDASNLWEGFKTHWIGQVFG